MLESPNRPNLTPFPWEQAPASSNDPNRTKLPWELPAGASIEVPGTLERIGAAATRGLARGTYGTASSLSEAVGRTEQAAELDKLAGAYARDVGSIYDIGTSSGGTIADTAVWATQAITENLPTLGLLAGAGMAGGAAAPTGGLSAAAGGVALAGVVDYLLQRGETIKEQRGAGIAESNISPDATAAVKTALDLVPMVALLRKAGIPGFQINKAVMEAAEKTGFLRRSAEAGGLVLAEGATEAAQTFADQATIDLMKLGRIEAPDDNDLHELFESFATGAVAAGPLAAVGAVRNPGRAAGYYSEDDLPTEITPEPETVIDGDNTPIPPGPNEPEAAPEPIPEPVTSPEPTGPATPEPNGPSPEPIFDPEPESPGDIDPAEPEPTPAPEPTSPGEPTPQPVPEPAPRPAKPRRPETRVRVVREEQEGAEAVKDLGHLNDTNAEPQNILAGRSPNATATEILGVGRAFLRASVTPEDTFRRGAGPNFIYPILPTSQVTNKPTVGYAIPSLQYKGKTLIIANPRYAQQVANETRKSLHRVSIAAGSTVQVGKGNDIPSLFVVETSNVVEDKAVKETDALAAIRQRLISKAGGPNADPSLIKRGFKYALLYAHNRHMFKPFNPRLNTRPHLKDHYDVTPLGGVTFVNPDGSREYHPDNILTDLMKKYMPRAKLVIQIENDPDSKMDGWASAVGPNEYVIGINERVSGTAQSNFTILHEFGHVITFHHFHTAPEPIKRAIEKDYQNWLIKLQEHEAKNVYYGGFGENRTIEQGGDVLRHLSYYGNFDEWFAQEFAKYIERKAAYGSGTKLQTFWKGLVDKLRSFWQSVPKEFQTSETFKDFLEYIAVTNNMDFNVVIRPSEGNAVRDPWPELIASAEGEVALSPGPETELQIGRVDRVYALSLPTKNNIRRFGWMQKYGFTLLQVGKHYPHLKPLQDYITNVRDYWASKSKANALANDTIKEWRKLPDKGERLSRFLLDMTMESEKVSRKLNNAEIVALARKHKLTPADTIVYQSIDKQMDDIITQLQSALTRDAQNIYTNPQELAKALAAINRDMAAMRNRNYFPLNRFGEYTLTLRASKPTRWNGQNFKKDEVISFETFENERARNSRLTSLERAIQTGGFDVSVDQMQTETFTYISMPPSMITALARETGLTPNQVKLANQFFAKLSPSESFRKHMLSRKGTAGFSDDAMRSYATYMLHAATHMARMQYADSMKQNIDLIKPDNRGNVQERSRLQSWLKDHYGYLINPGNEWASVRGALFNYHLGFNIKSAFVNLTQIPMVAYPYLAARHGDLSAVAALTKAMKDMSLWVTTGKGLSPGEITIIQQGRDAGFLDESLATELAGVAEGGNLARIIASSNLDRKLKNLSRASSFLFQKAELFNRHVTFLAAARLATGTTPMFDAGREAVETSMFEYGRWNRPVFMRGKKSVLFLFQNYTQHMLHFYGNDVGAKRALLMTFAMAGMTGLPFADDAVDLLEAITGLVKRALGQSGHVDFRTDIREIVEEIGLNPDFFMHGASRSSFGLTAIGAPAVDVSGSLSMGRIIPGVEPISRAITGGTAKPDALLARTAEDAGGPAVSLGYRMLQAITSNNPSTWQRFANVAPTVIRDISRASYMYTEGAAPNNLGDRLTEFDPSDPDQMMEIIAQAMSFRPTRLAQQQEKLSAQREPSAYYNSRRALLFTQYFQARKVNDREALADVRDAIREYNKSVPFPTMRIAGDDLTQSYKSRLLNQKKREAGILDSMRNQALVKEVGEAYPVNPAP